jgi:LPXTG-motif cell wall-anchored protein
MRNRILVVEDEEAIGAGSGSLWPFFIGSVVVVLLGLVSWFMISRRKK